MRHFRLLLNYLLQIKQEEELARKTDSELIHLICIVAQLIKALPSEQPVVLLLCQSGRRARDYLSAVATRSRSLYTFLGDVRQELGLLLCFKPSSVHFN